jgi:AcrR family transcriptional regulator
MRRYDTVRRSLGAQGTRQKILDSATKRFVSRGYAGTTMRAVAADAGVSLPTVESIFGTKPRLLKAAIDVAIAGDDAPVAMLKRPWAVAAEAEVSAFGFVSRFARALREAAVRSAGLIEVAHEAARTDGEIAHLDRRLAKQRATTVAWVVDGLRHRASLRTNISRQAAIDSLWILMDPAVYTRLTGDRRWSSARYETWFVEVGMRIITQPIEGGSDRDRRVSGDLSRSALDIRRH